jgi:hypothetical protein
MNGWDMGEYEPAETSRRDPRVAAVLDRLDDKVFEATREAIDAFDDLNAADPSLRIPTQRLRGQRSEAR